MYGCLSGLSGQIGHWLIGRSIGSEVGGMFGGRLVESLFGRSGR